MGGLGLISIFLYLLAHLHSFTFHFLLILYSPQHPKIDIEGVHVQQ